MNVFTAPLLFSFFEDAAGLFAPGSNPWALRLGTSMTFSSAQAAARHGGGLGIINDHGGCPRTFLRAFYHAGVLFATGKRN